MCLPAKLRRMGDDSDDSDDRRDILAEERTRLARERTTLAHVRTGFAAFLFGIAIERLYQTDLAVLAGVLFLLVGSVFITAGGVSFLLSRKRTRTLLRELGNAFYEL